MELDFSMHYTVLKYIKVAVKLIVFKFCLQEGSETIKTEALEKHQPRGEVHDQSLPSGVYPDLFLYVDALNQYSWCLIIKHIWPFSGITQHKIFSTTSAIVTAISVT